MPTKKGETTAKKGKAEEAKKRGKDNKKGGKEEKNMGKNSETQPAKGKGKDLHAKKGRKPASESEEISEEEEEVLTANDDEDEDNEEEVVTKKVDKVRGKTALKGASKAMAMKGFKSPKVAPPSDDKGAEQEAKTKTEVKKGMSSLNLKKMSDIHIKGASKAMMGFGLEGQKKNAAPKVQKTADVRSHMKGASKVLTGLTGKASPFGFSSKQQQVEKAKPKRNLKSTSRLFLGLSKKKKSTVANKPLLGSSKLFAGFGAKFPAADKKPGLSGFSLLNKKEETPKENTPPKKSINLSSLGAKKKMASDAKELGGRFKGMFGKNKGLSKFKNKSWMLGRIATATNWLSGRILNGKGQGRLRSRGGGYQQKRLTFENRDARRRQTHYYNEAYENDDEEYPLDEDYHGRMRTRCSPIHPVTDNCYNNSGEELDYYDDDDWYGYDDDDDDDYVNDDDGNFYNDEFYYDDDDVNYNNYPYCYYDDEYEGYCQDEEPEYYGDDGMLYMDQGPYNGFYDPHEFYGDPLNYNWGYYYRIPEVYSRPSAVPDVYGLCNEAVIGYIDPAALHNPYQQCFYMEPGLNTAEMGQTFGEMPQMPFPVAEPFRFPRPKVRVFGKDILEVENVQSPLLPPPPPPPSPSHPPPSQPHPVLFPSPLSGQILSNFEMPSDIDTKYQQLLPTYHPQLHHSGIPNQMHNSSSQISSPTAVAGQQEYFSPPNSTSPLMSHHLSQMPPQTSFINDTQIFQMGQVLPGLPQMPPPLPLPRPQHQRRALPLHMRPRSAKAPASNNFSPPNIDLHMGIKQNPHHLQHRRLIKRKSVANQHLPTSTFENQRQPYSTSFPPHCKREVSMSTRQPHSRAHGGTEMQKSSPTVSQPQSSRSPLSSPMELPRKTASPPPSPRLASRRQPPTEVASFSSNRPHLFESRKQSQKMRQSTSPATPPSQRQSPSLPERSQSPRPHFFHSIPYQTQSTPHTRSEPLRYSQRVRRGAGDREHIPLGAVKPSPASPYLKRRSRHGPPVTQHVAPFRSSIHSGLAHSSGQAGSRVGTPILARSSSNTTGIRESKQIQPPQGGFHRPVGRGQPLVRMPRKQQSCQSRQSLMAPPAMLPLSPQPSLKQSGPPFSHPTVPSIQHHSSSPHSLQHSSPLPPHSTTPVHHITNPELPFPQSPHSLGPSSFQGSMSQPSIPPTYPPPSHTMMQYNYKIIDPGPSPKLTNALPLSHNAVAVQKSYLPNPSTTTLRRQEVKPEPTPGLSSMNCHLNNASYSSPLQRNANIYTNVLSPHETANPQAPAAHSTQPLPSALLTSQLRNASFSTSHLKHYSPMLSASTNPSLPTPQSGTVNYTALLPPSGDLTSKFQAFNNRFPGGALSTISKQKVEQSEASMVNGSEQSSHLPVRTLPSAFPDSGLQPTHLPDGTFESRSEATTATSTSGPVLSSALLNANIRKATYRLPDGTFVSRIEPEPVIPSPMLSSALLNHNVRNASYQLPDSSFLKHPESKTNKPDHAVSPEGLSAALSNANLHRDRFQQLEGSSLFSRNQTQGPTSPLISSAMQNPSLQGASYTLQNTSHLRPPGSEPYQSGTGNPINNSQASTSPQTLDLSSALSRNPIIREAKYQLSDGNILIHPGIHSPPIVRSPTLSGALQNRRLQGTSFHLPSSYAVVSPQVQGSGPDQHWAQGPGVEVLEVQHDMDGWGAERALSSVQTFNKRAIYRDGEFMPPHCVMGQRPMGHEPKEWNLSREGEPHGKWFDKMYSIRSLPTMSHWERQEEDGVDDMTQLEELQEGAVLQNLKQRFERDIIYTNIGSILVSVNPYKVYNIYGTDQMLLYKGRALGESRPHLFALTNAAYSKMMDAKHNQVIIISGESGSGKTEATKLVLRYLAEINHESSIAQQIEILEAAPLLESFGNAKTVRNDNSSRFGKYIEVFLEDGVISGAITSQYLLEKSRIVFQAKDERNYHIFYEMLAGLPSQQKQAFYLQEAETYYYLNQGGDCGIPEKNDAEDFLRLLAAMENLRFSSEDQSVIFRVLSSILHLGNVYFQKHEADGQEVASVVSAQEIRVVAELLQISPEGLQKAITFKVTETMREKIYTPLTVESAVDARDAVAKILYSLLFHWLTERINAQVYPHQHTTSISILDIYGFEDLAFNSLEQLCINYANEYLQFFFNRIVFKEEQEEYNREQIPWQDIPFSDNQPCIDLIAAKPHGILRILDDQSCFPQATDHTFLQKCHYHHGNNPLYLKPKMPLPEFTIKHFAGRVTYQVYKFHDKNFDQVRQDVLDLFIQSKNKMVSNLFVVHADVAVQHRGGQVRKSNTVTRKYQAPTVSNKFQQSLLELVEKMERCNPFFVRCIKPNNIKKPGVFDDDLVSSQLKHSGVLETIRIRREGYPVRMPFCVFLFRYKSLVGMSELPAANGENCVAMLSKLCPLGPGEFHVGVTKLFLKEDIYQMLECKRERMRHLAALTLQRYARMFFVRKRYLAFRKKIVWLQAQCRGFLTRKRYAEMRQNVLRVRSVVHMYITQKQYIKMKLEAQRKAEQEKRRREMELSKREVVNVTHLAIPAELGALLQTAGVRRVLHSDCLALLQAPHIQEQAELKLPLDINNYPFYRYVQMYFREPKFGMLTEPLKSPLTRPEDDLSKEALDIFNMVLRFMGDPHLNGAQENIFGNYIIQRGLSSPGLRDEILAQVVNQVWRNVNADNAERGWLLLLACVCSFAPSPRMDKHLLKFVSDHSPAACQALLQHRLIQANQKTQLGSGSASEAARTYPLSLLEWTANRKRANLALHVHCFDGASFLCPVHSWTCGEDLAGDILRHRGVSDWWRGSSVLMKEHGQWVELAGHDYVMDLIADLELPSDFPKHKSYFIISSDDPAKVRANAGLALFGSGFDSDDELPTGFPLSGGASSRPAYSLPDSDGYFSHVESDALSDGQNQRGMDRYLDSLFDPVLSDGNMMGSLSARMKGGGGIGITGGGRGQEDAHQSTSRPYPPGIHPGGSADDHAGYCNPTANDVLIPSDANRPQLATFTSSPDHRD
ncbi:unconventional myosin-XV isoform X4 [Takifugu rubripes]|uniref:unconventional myosin-XV isoform X4 n=1 Tax=Takifugu rubripes TaxID=31033 RepID=UPI0011457F04|nr:unconventional myosin-XV isoform X4 [Takifugu rubripes]